MTRTPVLSTAPVPDTYQWFLDNARKVKDAQVASYDGTDQTTDDIVPAVHVAGTSPFRFEVIALAPQIDRDMGLAIAKTLVTATSPDYVTFMADAHAANEMTNPATGKPWAPGEMQNACDVEGACSVGVLDDCLIFQTAWPSGRQRAETYRYTVTKGQGVGASSIAWTGYGPAHESIDTEDEGDHRTTGRVPDSLAYYFTDPLAGIIKTLAEQTGLTAEEAFVLNVMGALTALGSLGVVAMVLTDHQPLLDRLEPTHPFYASPDGPHGPDRCAFDGLPRENARHRDPS